MLPSPVRGSSRVFPSPYQHWTPDAISKFLCTRIVTELFSVFGRDAELISGFM
jgi:hypothetical protein